MGENIKIKLLLKGLGCANCANKIEDRVNKLKSIEEASLNFTTSILNVEIKRGYPKNDVVNEIIKIVKSLEPHVVVEENKKNLKGGVKRAVCTSATCGHSHINTNFNLDLHSNDHNHKQQRNENVNDKNIFSYIKDNLSLIIGALIYFVAIMTQDKEVFSIIMFIVSYVLIGGEVVLRAIKNIFRGELFDENFLMSIATIGAFAIGEYPEAVAVMLFYQVGEMLQSYAVDKSRKSISALMNIRADYATVIKGNKEVRVSPEDVNIKDTIIIKPGERIPLDGIVLEGNSFIDTSALTGESVPRQALIGNEILAGGINTNGVLKVKVTKEYGESTVARILELVENASNKKAPTEKFITKFAKLYTPIVVGIALMIAIMPPIFTGQEFSVWIYRALSILVVSCPCALVVSIPLGFFSSIGGASKKGILIKGGNYLEALKNVDTVVFDKTGTLTKGVFKVTEINSIDISKEQLLEIAALGESNSNHPIALSIIKEYGKPIDKGLLNNYEEISGHGIRVNIKGKDILLGNTKLMDNFNIIYNEIESIGTIVHIAIDGLYKGNIVISDEIKESSKIAIESLKEIGIKKTVMLTGDNRIVAEKVGKSIGIDTVYSELLPADKVERVEELIDKKNLNKKLIFVGDGINDAPVLARADIGIAMGGIGSDAAIEAADVVLMQDKPEAIVEAIKIARKTNTVLWQNIIFALTVKVLVMILVSLGLGTMWEAVFADVGVTILAVINSSRCLR